MSAVTALTLWALACGPVQAPYPVPGCAWSYEPIVRRAAAEAKITIFIGMAIPAVETTFDHRKISRANARGLFQIMQRDQTYLVRRFLDTDRFNWRDPSHSATLGLLYLAHLVKRFHSLRIGVITYNMGPTAWDRGRAMPVETWWYNRRVLEGRWW